MSTITPRSLLAFVLRVVLYMPLRLVAGIVMGLAECLERLGDALMDCASAMRQATAAPYVKGWQAQIDELQYQERVDLLGRLRRWTQ